MKTKITEQRALVAQLSKKLAEHASWLNEVSGTPEYSKRHSVYISTLNEWRNASQELRDIEPHCNVTCQEKTEYARLLEEKRALKEANVTSSTYENSQKKLMKSVDGFISNKRFY